MYFQLVLKDIGLDVKLGHPEEERSLPQRVFLQVKLQFVDLPLACTTDNLQDTICYASLSCDLQKFCDCRSFKLIESFAYQLYQFLKKKIAEMTSEKINVFLCITKNPPLATLSQCCFIISDY
ncbi:MAG: dihydroneopterin aldolase [Pseudomonadota bacterium]